MPRAVIICDEGSPPEWACWWRPELRAALQAAGAAVTEVGCPAVPARPRWLPARLRRRLARVHHPDRPRPGRVARLAYRLMAPHLPGLARADVVVAESPAVAAMAAADRVGPDRLWLAVAPPGHLPAGDPAPYATAVARVAPLVGGFLARDEPARESVERVLSASRPQVEVVALAGGDAGPVATPARRAAAGNVVAGRMVGSADPPAGGQRATRRVLVSGFDLKFATDLAARLDQRADLAVTVDEWPDLGTPGARTRRRLRAADAVLAEWARPSAAWLSRRTRPGQLLVVRLHRYELDTPHPRAIAIDRVDAVVYIAPLFGRRIRDELGWPEDRLVHIPNYLDLAWLDRPKLPGARFALGFVGIEVARKRFDLALDVLAAVRREDPRYVLRVRSVLPWHNPYGWHKPTERSFAAQCFERIEQDPLLRNGVIFDQPGRDMARWYRRIGLILSTSDEEGSHTAVAEGMASGAVPVVRTWPGADEVYGKEWLHEPGEDAVAAVLECADEQVWQERGARARAEVRHSHDPQAVVAAWADLLHGDLPAARSHFEARPAGAAVAIPHQEGTPV